MGGLLFLSVMVLEKKKKKKKNRSRIQSLTSCYLVP